MKHEPIESITSFIGYRVKFWLYSTNETFTADCLNIFRFEETGTYFFGMNFSGETDVVGVDISDIRMLKRMKRSDRQLTVVRLPKKEENSNDDRSN